MIFSRWLALAIALIASSSWAAPGGDPKALQGAADRALARERFCDAAYLYRRLDEMKSAPEALIAASDAAAGGGDRAGALRFLETFQARHASHRLAAGVATKIEALRAAIAKYGAGAACKDPPAECGNGAPETGEDCDDGNRVDFDTCPATCKTGATTPTTTTTLPPPVKVPPAKVPPAKVEPPQAEAVTQAAEPEPEPVRAIDREPDEEDDADAVAVEPAPTPAPEPPPKVVIDPKPAAHLDEEDEEDEEDRADKDHDKKVRSIDDEPASGGSPVAGIILAGVGGLSAIGGGVAVGVGLIPFLGYLGNVNKQTDVQQQYLDARSDAERRSSAGDAADLRASLVNDANSWNQLNQWVAFGGAAAAAAGIGALIGGIVLVASSGDSDEPLHSTEAER